MSEHCHNEHDPNKQLILMILIGVFIAAGIYTLVHAAWMWILSFIVTAVIFIYFYKSKGTEK